MLTVFFINCISIVLIKMISTVLCNSMNYGNGIHHDDISIIFQLNMCFIITFYAFGELWFILINECIMDSNMLISLISLFLCYCQCIIIYFFTYKNIIKIFKFIVSVLDESALDEIPRIMYISMILFFYVNFILIGVILYKCTDLYVKCWLI